jgi:hypothetical protein
MQDPMRGVQGTAREWMGGWHGRELHDGRGAVHGGAEDWGCSVGVSAVRRTAGLPASVRFGCLA